jgi:hypothetical protein
VHRYRDLSWASDLDLTDPDPFTGVADSDPHTDRDANAHWVADAGNADAHSSECGDGDADEISHAYGLAGHDGALGLCRHRDRQQHLRRQRQHVPRCRDFPDRQ